MPIKYTREDITPELWADFKEIQASMAIEGFELTDEQRERCALRYLKSGIREKLYALKEQADRERRPYAGVCSNSCKLKQLLEKLRVCA